MVNCPACDAVLDIEEDEVDEGDVLSCDECGATLTVASVNPLEVEAASDDDDLEGRGRRLRRRGRRRRG